MKQTILMTLLSLIAGLNGLFGQNTMAAPVDLGIKSTAFIFTDTKNTSDYTNDYVGRTTNDVFYKFTLSRPMDVVISHCGSVLTDTYVHLLDASGNQIAYNDDYSGTGKCSNTYQSYLKMTNLASGTYYVVSEGYSQNGSITTSIQASFPFGGLQTSIDQNYILSITPTVATSDISTLPANQMMQTIQYFDGLGRPIETVQKAITPTGKDLVNMTEYDGFGREYRHWLPITSSGNGAYVDPIEFTNNQTTLYGGDLSPYATNDYEPSPLNRITGKYGAGASWYAGKKNDSILYQTNALNEVAYLFVNSSNQLQMKGNYAANTLYKTIAIDEDGKTATEYKDKKGQVVMKRSSTNVDTYYVYNDLGQLSYVLPPMAADLLMFTTFTSDNNYVLTNYAYLYKYDERGNNVVKRLPGCDSICMVYDKANRLIMSQDGNQRLKYNWMVTKYDQLGRVLYTGLLTGTSTQNRKYFKAILDNQVVTETYDVASTFYNTGYTCKAPLTGIKPLNVNYYDDYTFINLAINRDSLYWVTPKTDYDNQYSNAKGLLTGTRSYILEQPDTYLTTAMYYDARGRVVQTRATNQLGGYEKALNHYDFSGNVLKLLKEHSTAYQPIPIQEIYRNDYDQAGRLKTTYYQLNKNAEILLIDQSQPNSYDELGRLILKKRHGGADTESYTYNILNWATMIKSGAFEEDLSYNSNLPSGSTACYNGNIAATTWTYNSSKYTYPYYYDLLNRLTATGGGGSKGYYESFVYDKQGNIQTLSRTVGFSTLDLLTISYNGNQVTKVNDQNGSQHLSSVKEYQDLSTTTNKQEFYYDKNGNMTADSDRNIITIRYNILNLPDTIQFLNGNQIINRYTADGLKLETEYFTMIAPIVIPLCKDTVYKWTYSSGLVNQTGIVYIDNLEYQIYYGNTLSPNLLKVYDPEGYLENINGSWAFNYYRKDHLGNNREVWRAAYIRAGGTNIAAATIQQTQYYPSGLPWSEGTGASAQSRKFNGMEFIEMHGYDTYDYGARGYYAAMGRFMTVDPLAEMDYSVSPYVYCKGNPIKFIDPTGMAWKKTVDKNNGEETGYEWVSDDQSYNEDGSLKDGLYEQAIFFSNNEENHPYIDKGTDNMGTSVATVYLADHTSITFDACTKPYDSDNSATLPAGIYDANNGIHHGKKLNYPALKVSDVGNNDSKVELGYPNPNPEYKNGETFAVGIDIHKAGRGNSTGKGVSVGCLLIDYNRWNEFIGLFNNSGQKGNPVSVTVSRTMAQPTNTNVLLKVLVSPIPAELLHRPDATYVANPYIK